MTDRNTGFGTSNTTPGEPSTTVTAGGAMSERAIDSATNPQVSTAGATTPSAPATNAPQASEADAGGNRSIGRRQSDRIIAASESGQRSLDQATSCARSDGAVVIAGPAGSGRKHFARAIHAWSRRSAQPLIVFPAASTPEALQQRELFGAADGGATLGESSAGALASAGGGTLVVDRIDQLEAGVRSELIQAIQGGSFRRPGQAEPIATSARLIATVADAALAGVLGSLNADIVTLEGLDARREDVLPLAAHFLAEVAEDDDIRPIGFTNDARNWLVEEVFTGNVRELRERIRQSVRLSRDGVISAESLMLATDGDEVPSFKDAKRAFETRYVEGLLRRCSGNISRAARLAKKDRKDFYDVIRRTGVDPGEFRN